jgi:hypothetical protein
VCVAHYSSASGIAFTDKRTATRRAIYLFFAGVVMLVGVHHGVETKACEVRNEEGGSQQPITPETVQEVAPGGAGQETTPLLLSVLMNILYPPPMTVIHNNVEEVAAVVAGLRQTSLSPHSRSYEA